MKNYYVYILASKPRGTIYIGMTSDLIRRVHEHKNGLIEGFTREYGVKTLVYYEAYNSVEEAIKREKQLKKWNRIWKMRTCNHLPASRTDRILYRGGS